MLTHEIDKLLSHIPTSWLVRIFFTLLLAASFFWLQVHYTAKTDFDAYKEEYKRQQEQRDEKQQQKDAKLNEELRNIAINLQRISDFMEGDKRQQAAIDNLQRDVRELEAQQLARKR